MTLDSAAISFISEKHDVPEEVVEEALTFFFSYYQDARPKLTDYTESDIAALYLAFVAGSELEEVILNSE